MSGFAARLAVTLTLLGVAAPGATQPGEAEPEAAAADGRIAFDPDAELDPEPARPTVTIVSPPRPFAYPATSDRPLTQALPSTIAGPPGAAPAQELVPFEEALARRRAANNPIAPPENPSRQSSGLRCIERADGSISCSQTTSIGSSPEARARAEAAARSELDRLSSPPPR